MKSSKMLFACIVLIVAVGLFIIGKVNSADNKGPDEILIGVNAPLTGMHAGFGEGNVYGEKAAADDINKQGGIFIKEYGRKIPVKVVVVDNQSDPRKAGALEEELILKYKVHFLAPPNQPIPLAIPQAIAAERYKKLRISGGTPEEPWFAVRKDASPKWDHTWTFAIPAIAAPAPKGSIYNKPGYVCMDAWVKVLRDYKDKTNKQMGVFASDEPDGRGWYEVIPNVLKEQGLTPHVENNLGLFSMDTTDFTTLIQKWKRLNIEIIWGNAPAPLFGTMWRQCKTMGFKPKLVIATRAGLFYDDVNAWGGDLPLGISGEAWWLPAYDAKKCPGIGGTTSMSLYQRWQKDTNKPLNPGIGSGYHEIQLLANAIERAGSLDTEKVNAAMAKTDMATIATPRFKFEQNNSGRMPVFFSQWFKVDKPWKWESKVVISQHDFIKEEAKLQFPLPSK